MERLKGRFGVAPPPALGGVLIAALTLLAYAGIWRAGFIWDDDTFLTQNRLIHAADGLRRFWFTTQATDYWPVTSSMLWFEWRLWGPHAAGYHAVNLALHIASAILLWRLLRRLAIPGAFIAALLFAVHPVNVESVAWITQRKNLLAMAFFLATLLLWEKGRYRSSIGVFVLALLSKGSVVILPLVLAGREAWRGNLNRRVFARLSPFFLLALAAAVANVALQDRGGPPLRDLSWLQRLLGAGGTVWFYLAKAVVPVRLMFFYPGWRIDPADARAWLPLAAAVAVTAVLWRFRRGGGRVWLAAWAYYVVALGPVLGFTDVYFMKFSPVADHYQHLALIAVVAMAGYGLVRLPPNGRGVAAAGLVTFLSLLTWRQTAMYRDERTLYETALRDNPASWLAHNNLGLLLYEAGERAPAAAQFGAALRLNPGAPEVHNNLGRMLADERRWPDALREYDAALRLKPAYAEAHSNRGNVLRLEGQPAAAIAEFREALRLVPDLARTRRGLALAEGQYALDLASAGRVAESFAHFEAALGLQPANAELHNDYGVALAQAGRLSDAERELSEAVRLKPDYPEAQANLRLVRSQAAAPGRIRS